MQILGLVLLGLLAGEEFIVRYGVQPALRSLDDRSHIRARVALVRRLRVVVPGLMLPAVALAVVVLVTVGGAGSGFRWGGAAALAAFVLISFLGTVPINMQVIDWRDDAPPANWRETVLRWERLDVARSAAAVVAFVCFVAALAART
ncbi:anthrone oxygenase family protein [Cryptosporangium sp. NPDC051539]|uniref:anthrone oxygenase family protein n=1 Tax=Cryptosporangium sp. NPDC051539 TaxID=3363962 RepID=UPI0037904EED